MPEVVLTGLRSEPLAQYLSALGVLRLVAEQADADATGHWQGDTFVLTSKLDPDSLVEFFVTQYRPSPILGPWNSGSGFYRAGKIGNKVKVLDQLLLTTDARLMSYREVVSEIRSLLSSLGRVVALDGQEKHQLLTLLRAEISDDALEWLDASLVITDEHAQFSPLLGTGGNDGNFEFSFNFILNIVHLLLVNSERGLLRACLFGEATPGMRPIAIGQFSPSQAGGINTTSSAPKGNSRVNLWGYVLMIEGALVPSGTLTRRSEHARGNLAFPFVVRASMSGYASAIQEENRNEIWLPLWNAPATFREVRHLFAEGRAKVPTRGGNQSDSRDAVDGLDFARAIASLGVNRGIDEFVRFGFQKRNGKSYFAVPLGRWVVRQSKGADLLAELDIWLSRLRGHVGSGKASSSVASATRRLENAIMDVCRREDWTAMLEVLICLGELESTIGRMKDRPLDPLPSLSPLWYWLTKDDPSTEYRLAASLAAAGLRPRLLQVEQKGKRRWSWLPTSSKTATWMDTASLDTNLIELLHRREIEDQQGHPDAPRVQPRIWATLADIAAFIEGPHVSGIDDRRLEALARGLSLIDWAQVKPQPAPPDERELPPAGFGLMALAREQPSTPGMLANAAAGRLDDATRLAIRRLHGTGLVFPIKRMGDDRVRTRRIAAALAFPLAPASLKQLERLLFPRHPQTDTPREEVQS